MGCAAAAGRPFGGRSLMRQVHLSSGWGSSVTALSLGVTILFVAGCAATREYDDVLHNRTPCNSCEGSPWAASGT